MADDKKSIKTILYVGIPIILLLVVLLIVLKNIKSEENTEVAQTGEVFIPESEEGESMSKRDAYEQEEIERQKAYEASKERYSDADFFADVMASDKGGASADEVFGAALANARGENAEARNKKQETRGEKRETRGEKEEARYEKQETNTTKSTSYTSTTSRPKRNTAETSGGSSGFSYEDARAQATADFDARKSARNSASTVVTSAETSTASSVQHGAETSTTSVSGSVGTQPRTRARQTVVQTQKNLVSACIHGDQIVTSGGTVRMRLLEELRLENITIPKGTIFYGIANISRDRMDIAVKNFKIDNYITEVKCTIYDLDAIEGLNLPDNVKADIMKMANSQNANSSDLDAQKIINTTSAAGGAGVRAVGTIANAIKSIGSNRIKEVKVNLKSNYKIFIK